ncbi:flagellar hook-length control protein FliK [Nitrosomonas sp.]|uniref:flagellar hook-length control protein FliK n=1 Tax=Nitrosomonas sp. TaxID=42353 RepID=UPI00330638D4
MISNPVNSAVIISATPADAISQTRPVSAVTPVPDATQSDTPPFTLGQKYRAQIGERLTNGHSIVNVAGRWLQMRMPASANPGDILELTLIEQSPRLKFLLHSGIQDGNNPTTLSPAGRLIAQLLSQPAMKAANEATPLLSAPPATGRERIQLPGQLQQALSISGLFYEAHLAQWLSGNRSLQQLRQEPQGRLPASATVSTTLAGSATTSPGAPQAGPLIQQQLHTLETGTIQWRGEIWPGQAMEWDIIEYPDDQGKAQADDEKTGKSGRWQTRIHLQLPNLGKITATVTIEPQGMRIRLDADSDEITRQLRKEQVALASAMQTTGMTIHAMDIQRHEAP